MASTVGAINNPMKITGKIDIKVQG
jgi:hypothetical protein